MTMSLKMLLKPAMQVALLAACTATIAAPALIAQDGPPPQGQGRGRGGPGMQAEMLNRMTKELALTADQVTQVKAIQEDGRKQMMAMREDTTTAGPDRRAKMMSMREAEQTKIKALLTDPQKVKYDAMVEKMKQNREQHRQDGGGTPPSPPPSL